MPPRDPYEGLGTPVDPYEGLGSPDPESSYLGDKLDRAGRSVTKATGETLGGIATASDAVSAGARRVEAEGDDYQRLGGALGELQRAQQLGANPDRARQIEQISGRMAELKLAADARQMKEREPTGSDPLQNLATSSRAAGDFIEQAGNESYHPDPARDEEIGSKLTEFMAPSALAIGSGPLAPIQMAAQMGEAAKRDAAAHGATPDQQTESFALNAPIAGIAGKMLGAPAMLGSVLGKTPGVDKAISAIAQQIMPQATKMIEQVAATTAGRIASEAVKAGLRGGAEMGMITGAGNVIAKDVAGYDPDRERTAGLGESMLYGAAGAAATGAAFKGAQELDTRKNIAETAATLKAQQEQLLAGRRPAQMFPADADGKVTNELPLPEGMERVETPRGVFHYNPELISPEQIRALSGQGAENNILGLGATSKPAATAAAAANREPLVTVTERQPDGTEVRTAVINQSAAEKTKTEMAPGTTPGNTLKVETPAATLAGRSPDFIGDLLSRDAQDQAQRQSAAAQEAAARAERQRALDAKKENVTEAMQQGAAILADPNAPYAAIDGAFKRVAFYADNNAIGITADQRLDAQRQQAKLAQRLATLEPVEQARRYLEAQKRLADDAAALAAQKQQRTTANQEFRNDVQAGRNANGGVDYNRLSNDELATRAQAGDASAGKMLMRRNDSAGDNRPTLLDVLARVKLPTSDPALGGELKLLTEGMTPEQRRTLIATKETTGLDGVAEVLRADYGFTQIKTPADVIDFVERALRGEDIRAERSGEGQVEFAAKRLDPTSRNITAETIARNVQPVPLDPAANFDRPNRENRAAIVPHLRGLANQPIINTQSGEPISFSNSQIPHLVHDAKGPDGFQALAKLRDLIATAVRVNSEKENSGRLNVLEVQRYIAALDDGQTVRPVRITVYKTTEGLSLHSLNVMPKQERHPSNMRGLASAHLTSSRVTSPITVADLLPSVKTESDGTASAKFATTTAPMALAERTTINREFSALAGAFPKLAELFKVRIGDIQSEFAEAGYRGQVPSNVEAAVWKEKQLIVIAARAWRDRKNGSALLTHEVAHLYWETLPPEAQQQLRALHARETTEKTGPLYDEQGHMRGSIQFERDRLPVSRVAADPDLPVKEWFSERIAALNRDWAEGKINRADASVLARIAHDIRQLYRRVVEAFAAHSNVDPDSELFETQFRKFIASGADVRLGEAAGTAYAQRKAEFAARPEFATGDDRHAQLREIQEQLAGLADSQEDQPEIEARGRALTAERDQILAEQRAAAREDAAAKLITDVRHPAAIASPEPGDAWAMVPKMTDAELRQEREKISQHIGDNYEATSRAERMLLNARIDAIRAEEKRREPEPRRNAQGDALVDPIPKTDRRAALLAELQRGRALATEGNRTGNDEALKEGTRLTRLSRERLDDEFPGWETPARPTTEQAPRAAPDATDTQPGANSEDTHAADRESSPFTGEGEAPEPIRRDKLAEIYGQSSYQPGAFTKTWRKIRDVLSGIRGPIPELPTFPASKLNAADSFIREKGPTFYNGIREFYRALKSGNDYVQRTAEEQVARIARPLIEAGGKFDANDYAKLQARQEQARRLRAENRPVPPGVSAEIAGLQSKMESNPYVLFNELVLMLNFKWRHENLKDSAGNPIRLPSSLNRAEINSEITRLGRTITAGPHAELIRTALERHMALVKEVAADLQSRELMSAEQLANPYYFPHLTLEIKRGGKTEQRELTPNRVHPGTEADFRGYLQDPVGSSKPIETDYLRALYYHLVQVGAHNLKADAIKNFARPYDVMAEVRERAAQLSKARGQPVSWEQAFDQEFAPRGYVRYGTDSRDAFPTIMVDRDKLARRLGAELTSEDLHVQLQKLGLKGIRLLPDDLKETLVQGARENWIVPARVAEALRGIADRESIGSHALDAAMKKGLGMWKAWKLFMPWNHIRYEYGNVVADVEKIFSSNPGTFATMPAAAREIREFWRGGEPSADLRAALKDGVINAITAQEMGGLSRLRAFKDFETTSERIWNTIKTRGSNFLSNPIIQTAWTTAALGNRMAGGDMELFAKLGDFSSPELSAFREAVFRYANYKNNLAKIRAGERPEYGGAYHRDIDAMQDSRPGAGDRAERQASQISKATFGDYGDLSVLGSGVRDKLIPFYSWMEVNFKYHANLFRNLRDMVRADQLSTAEAAGKGARAAATFAAGFGARAAGGMVLRLALPYVAVALWNSSGDRDQMEKELSDEDRRRFHVILGRTADGKVNVIYGQTALIDVIKWFSGAAFAQQAGAYLNGKTDFRTAFSAWKDQLVPDFLNNTAGSAGPYLKMPYTYAFKKNPFPDITDMRTVPAYDMRRVILGQAFDDFTADYTSKDFGTWTKQLVLQVRQRDPEQWAFFDIKDKASQFLAAATGTKRNSDIDAPDQQVLRNFRRAIYKGDIEAAVQFYQRLLGYGYTAERFKESIRSQEPLSILPKQNGLRRAFVESLTPEDEAQLERAERYYQRMAFDRGHERGLFPSQRSGGEGLMRYQENPQVDRLRQSMEDESQLDQDALQLRADRTLRQSLKKTHNTPKMTNK